MLSHLRGFTLLGSAFSRLLVCIIHCRWFSLLYTDLCHAKVACRGKHRGLILFVFFWVWINHRRGLLTSLKVVSACHIRCSRFPLMCWAERAGQPGCILLTGWNHMSAWMQFAKRLILPSSKCFLILPRLKWRDDRLARFVFVRRGRRMGCLYWSQATRSHVICPKYPVTFPWSPSHPRLCVNSQLGSWIQPTECIVSSKRHRCSCSIVHWG